MNEDPSHIMPVESGKRYIIINQKSDTVVDLDINDKTTVQCWTLHDGLNQRVREKKIKNQIPSLSFLRILILSYIPQWDFTQVEGGWHIRNAKEHYKYLGFGGDPVHPHDGTKVLGLEVPEGSPTTLWHIWPDKHIPDGFRSVS